MTAREYLSQAYRIDQRINSKLEQIASLRALAAKVTSTLSDMPCNPKSQTLSMENIICKMVDLENEINNDIDNLLDLKNNIVTAIKRIENPKSRMLLELRYLCFKSWEQIAVDMGYNSKYIFRLHDKALEKVLITKSGE
ncbi:hypothetical protein ACOBQJ_13050 [Pelotomaculum propionicicum]|uniref:hypothetical protein n=1 Tax=Pelotomaculum propionicicum TaxID=258475 RepID=UPI003B768EBD